MKEGSSCVTLSTSKQLMPARAPTPAPPLLEPAKVTGAATANSGPFVVVPSSASTKAEGGDGKGGDTAQDQGEFDEEEDTENSLSLAAIEAELKPKVLQTLDDIADAYQRLRRL